MKKDILFFVFLSEYIIFIVIKFLKEFVYGVGIYVDWDWGFYWVIDNY